MILLLLFLTLALGISFLCSILEAVVLSVTPSYIASEQEKGSIAGKRWEHIKHSIDRTLAGILSLNTIAHTVGAAGVGVQASSVFGEEYFGVISAVLTLLILIISEIIPKTLGAGYWRQIAPACLPVLAVVQFCMWPLVILSQGITRFFARKDHAHSVSRDDIAALAWMGEDQGVLSGEESAVIRSIVHFRSLTAKDIMTPRTVIFSLSSSSTVGEILEIEEFKKFSRIPVYDGHSDNIHAFVRKDDILDLAAQGTLTGLLKSIERPLLTVLSNQPLLALLRNMTVNHYQMILVVNEFGDTLGLVTMEDLVESMLGLEIVDETDSHPNMQQLARNLWAKRSKS